MADTASGNAEENKPLNAGENDKQDNMVEINLENPRDPPKPSQEQQVEAATKQQAIPQSDVPRQPEKDWAKEVGMACNKGYNWFPLGIFAWLGGFLLIACAIGDMITMSTNFIEFWLYVYLLIGAILILIIDMPMSLTSKISIVIKFQLILFDWVKLFRRIWGRTILYIIMMITCASFLANGDGDPSEFRSVPWISGIYLLVIIVLSYIFSYIAAKKYNAIREYIIKSTVISKDIDVSSPLMGGNGDEEQKQQEQNGDTEIIDDDMVMKKLISKFDELDVDKSGKLGMNEIAKLGDQCGNAFSASEKYAVFLLLDKECNGEITKPEWIMQLRKHKNIKML